MKGLYLDLLTPGDPERFLKLLVEADLSLMESGRFRWCKGRVTLTPVDGIITLPETYASILGVQVDKRAHIIHDEEYEFTPDGVGDIDVGDLGGGAVKLIDQGLTDDGLRHYKVTGQLPDGVLVHCLCHFAPVALFDEDMGYPTGEPDTNNDGIPDGMTDTTRCPLGSALKLAMQGTLYADSSDINTSRSYFATALKKLDDYERGLRGGAKQIMSIRPNGPGIRRIRQHR